MGMIYKKEDKLEELLNQFIEKPEEHLTKNKDNKPKRDESSQKNK